LQNLLNLYICPVHNSYRHKKNRRIACRWLIAGGMFAIHLAFFASLLVYRYDGLSLLRDEQMQQAHAKQQVSRLPIINPITEKKNLHLFKKFQLEGVARPLAQSRSVTVTYAEYYDHYTLTGSARRLLYLPSRGPPVALHFIPA